MIWESERKSDRHLMGIAGECRSKCYFDPRRLMVTDVSSDFAHPLMAGPPDIELQDSE